jgi:hypothetical protein
MKKLQITGVQEILSIDYRSLFLFRVLIGGVIIIDAINRFSLVPAFYSDQGIVPRSLVELGAMEHAYHFQLLFLNGSEWFAYMVLSLIILTGLCIVLGYKTKIAIFVAWLLIGSIITRDSVTANSGDVLLVLLLFWSLFLPVGKQFSIDQLRNRTKVDKSHFISSGSVAMYIQFALVYVTTGLYKAQYLQWREGTHLYYTFSRFEFLDPLAFAVYPFNELLTFLTHFTLYLELFGPLLFFIPIHFVKFRMVGVVMFIGLQISVILTMNVGVFSYVSIAQILLFIPTIFWESNYIQNVLKPFGIFKNLISSQTSLTEDRIVTYSNGKRGEFNTIKSAFVAGAVLYMVFLNITALSNAIKLPDWVKKPGVFLKFDKSWAMFSSPVYTSEYFKLLIQFKNGTQRNLLDDYQTVYQQGTSYEHHVFTYNRWRKFVVNELKFGKQSKLFAQRTTDFFVKNELIDGYQTPGLEKVELIIYVRVLGPDYNHQQVYENVLYSRELGGNNE